MNNFQNIMEMVYCIFFLAFSNEPYTQQRRSDLCVSRNVLNFDIQVSVSDLYISTIGPSTLLEQSRWTDVGTI
jgi:hypothetical protein